MSGNPGHTGHTGATGRKGLQGTPYGAPGTTFYSSTGRVDAFDIIDAGVGQNSILLTTAGDVYRCDSVMFVPPEFVFPSNLTSDHYGTFWTITNGLTDGPAQEIIIAGGIFKLTIPGSVLTCQQGANPAQFIRLGLTSQQSITFVFFAGSGATAEYIAF